MIPAINFIINSMLSSVPFFCYLTRPDKRSRFNRRTGLNKLLSLIFLFVTTFASTYAQTPGQSLHFDGVDDYVSLGSNLGNFGTGDFTIEIKLQTTFSSANSSYTYLPILAKRQDCGNSNIFGLILNANGSLVWEMSEANGVNAQSGTTTGIACNDGAWHQATIVRSGSSLKVYIDGIESMTLTGTPTNLGNSSPFVIGLNGLTCSPNRFKGNIDEIRIWSVARTATQINDKQSCELNGNETGLVAYYNFNQGTGEGSNSGVTSLTNAVSGGSAGTLNYFALSGNTSNWTTSGAATKCVNCNTFVTRTNNTSIYDIYVIGNTIYAATAAGLSISTDGGQTFTNKAINGSVSAASVFVTGNVIYTSAGPRLSRSTDGGQTFTTLTDQSPGIDNLFAQDNIIMASKGGGYGYYILSTNGGSSFTTKQITEVLNAKGTINDIFGAKDRIYLAVSGSSRTGTGLYVSTDNGNTFTLNPNLNSGLTGRSVYAVNDMIYFGTTNGLYISSNNGQTFTQRTTANGLGGNTVFGIYAVGTRIYAATNNGLSISTDGGQTFINHTTDNGLASNTMKAVSAAGTTVFASTAGGLSIASFGLQTRNPTPVTQVTGAITIAPGQSVTLTAAATNTSYTWSTGSNAQSIIANSTDLYSVTATGDCPGTASVQVTVLQAAAGTTTAQSALAATNCPVKLTATGLSGQRFQATGPGGYLFNDAYPGTVTNKEITLTNIKQPGTYTLRSVNASGVTTAVNSFNVTGSGCN